MHQEPKSNIQPRMNTDNTKPLFIPLCREWYERFASSEKTTEFRAYGPRWNERVCVPGRRVTLSCGYGKKRRVCGRIKDVRKIREFQLPETEWLFFEEKLKSRITRTVFLAITIEIKNPAK